MWEKFQVTIKSMPWNALARFFDDECRDERQYLIGKQTPKVLCGLLAAGNDNIAVTPARAVAHDARFDVDLGFHGLRIALLNAFYQAVNNISVGFPQ